MKMEIISAIHKELIDCIMFSEFICEQKFALLERSNKMIDYRQQLHDFIDKLNESQIIYDLTLLKKLFGSR